MEDALERLGIDMVDYGEFYYNGYYYDSLRDALWAGVLGFCLCGEPSKGLKKLREVLNSIHTRTFDEDLILYYYIFDREKLTEHSFSVYNSRLTSEGEDLLFVLQSLDL